MLPHTLERSLASGALPRKARAWSPAARIGTTRSTSPGPPVRIGIALFRGAEELDCAGPWEVFAYWADRWPDEAEVFTIAETLEPVRCARGLRIVPDRAWDMEPAIDVLIYPGGRGTQTEARSSRTLQRLRSLHDRGVLLASVCTGSLVFAASGILDGLAATTHHDAFGDLRSVGTDIAVRTRDRFIDTGPIVTAAGVSAGIDMALHLVARLHSPGRADLIRRAIEYRSA